MRVLIIALFTQIVIAVPPKLPNLGNSCYMNAAMQTLFAMTDLNKLILSYKPIDNLPHYLALPVYKKLLQEKGAKTFDDTLQAFFNITDISLTAQTEWDAIKKYVTTLKGLNLKRVQEIINGKPAGLEKDFLSLVLERNKDLSELTEDRLKDDVYFFLFDKYIPRKCQQSAVEMVEKFLAELIELNPPHVDELFMKIQDYVVYPSSGFSEPIEKEKAGPSLRIAVPHEATTPQNLIESYFVARQTDQQGIMRQRKIVTQVPDYVLLALGRTETGQFLTTALTNLESITLQPAWFESHTEQVFEYKLIAVICHSGGVNLGHYRAFVYDPDDKEWYVGDDKLVRPAGKDLNNFKEAADKREIATHSTFLIYQKSGVVPQTPPPLHELYRELSSLAKFLA